jgi:thiamine biosynthesis lipoprotein
VTAGSVPSNVNASGTRRVLIPSRVPLPTSFVALRTLRMEEISGRTMGTTWSAKLALPVEFEASVARRDVEQVLRSVVDEMSPWEPESHLSRFNRAPGGTWHDLPDAFFQVLSTALAMAEQSGGAYDPTLGASVELWGFGPGQARSGVPQARDVGRARGLTGWRRLALDRERRRALQPGGLELDLNAIAKGFAVDAVTRALKRRGIANSLVEIGGELRGEGLKPDGTPWWVALEQPRGSDRTHRETVIALSGLAVATSGDDQRFVEVGGRRYGHTLDPRTGAPLTHDLVSVTVAARDCMTADALATALLVLGPEHGPAFAARNAVAARFVRAGTAGPTEQLSPALAAMLD